MAKKPVKLAEIANWAFTDPENLAALLHEEDLKAVVTKNFGGRKLSAKDLGILHSILHDMGDKKPGTKVRGFPVLNDILRIWLLTPAHSPRDAAKVDPWKGYT